MIKRQVKFSFIMCKITVSPMEANWVVRLLSDVICPDIPAFENFVTSGAFKNLVQTKYPDKM
jgi:hypothetical protein